MKQSHIRNFAIIAHIDHGKSTLADQIMSLTQTVSAREQHAQLLDDMTVEQAHGVTVKARTVRNYYQADDGQEYEYNLIDTLVTLISITKWLKAWLLPRVPSY